MIGIIGALDEEMAIFKQDMKVTIIQTIAGRDYLVGTMNGREVVVTRCGMGKVNAASCAATMIEHFHPQIILNTGVGGALDDSLQILDIMIASDVVQHDYNLVPLGYQEGQVDMFDSPFFKCDGILIEAISQSVRKLGLRSHLVRFATGDQFIEKPEDKKELVRRFQAQLCDMETGAIAQVCALHGVRFGAIRTVSDSSTDDGAIQFQKFLSLAAGLFVDVVEDVIENL